MCPLGRRPRVLMWGVESFCPANGFADMLQERTRIIAVLLISAQLLPHHVRELMTSDSGRRIREVRQ